MERTNINIIKRMISGLLAVIMVFVLMPIVSAISPDAVTERIVDPSTMDDWTKWFGSQVTNTENAGGVWTDKSVFADASAFPKNTVTLDDGNNFLVALSAIASNKTIVGYSNIPTDTMFVLDVSGSMKGNVDDLVIATNDAIKKLFEVNNHNRIGVILYSGNSQFGTSNTGTATVLLPLDRYTAKNNTGDFLKYSSDSSSEYIEVASQVYGTKSTRALTGSKEAVGGTYIQNGLYKAYQEFASVENTSIESGFQAGMQIMPIIVLMSDGAPTSATTSYTNIGTSNVGTGSENGANAGMAFLTQLTASYVHAKVEEKYGETPLFYTLGLGVSNSETAKSVLDPVGSTQTLWNSYKRLSGYSTLTVNLPGTSGRDEPSFSGKSIYRNSYCTLEDYVDEYYPASNSTQMIESFQKIVNEIIIQSRYYPTNLQGNDPDFGGYITFEDQIGEYMEVKDVKGILLGDVLFDGAKMASQINSSSDGLGTVEDPTALGDEFIRAIRARLNIDAGQAQALAQDAWDDRQLYYVSDEDYGNYITWYAASDGSYISFADKDDTVAPANAVYKNRSYGFLGKATGNIKDSDMMYMSVQVHTNIKSGHQTMIWKIPAALVPMITYSVTLKGDSVENATDIKLDIQEASPIRLVFEVGLRSDINELNVSSIMAAADSKFKTDGGYYFWTNRWNQSGGDISSDIATTVQFHPSTENERYYFVEDSDIYISAGNGYEKVDYRSADGFSQNTKYYRLKTVFELADEDTGAASKKSVYEELTETVLAEKKQREDGTWYIPRGTVSHYFDNITTNKEENNTDSLYYAADPFVKYTNASYDAYSYLGNNGRLKLIPAQGIMLSKIIDKVLPNTDTSFDFVIELDAPAGTVLPDEYTYVLADTGKYEGEKGIASVEQNKIEITVPNGKTVFITGLPTGTSYKITEKDDSTDYGLKAIEVNGVHSANGSASGTVGAYVLDDVEFVNTPLTKGELIIDKTVTHPFGDDYDVPENLEFSINIALEGTNVAGKTFNATAERGNTTVTSDSQGIIKVTLANGEAIAIHDIPSGTKYTVTETDIPKGFSLSSSSTGLNGTISDMNNAHASLVNDYVPEAVRANVDVVINKVLSGREFKEGDSFEFVLHRYSSANRSSVVEVDRAIATAMADIKNGKLQTNLDMNGESFGHVGVYHYAISEVDASLGGKGIAGVTYDDKLLHFSVTVTDNDMDGSLEISAVTPVTPVTVSGDSAIGWTVSGEFNNSYKANVPATVTIDITKYIESTSGAHIGKNGFSFGLYDEQGSLVAHSNLTDVNGKAVITMTYHAGLIGNTYNYVLKELVHGTPIPGMTYSTEEHKFTVTVIDNNDGTVGTLINDVAADGYSASFTNVYDPTDAFLILSGIKELSGRVVNENEFSFSLYETDSTYTLDGVTPISTVFAGYDRSFAFPMMTYGEIGTKYYVITENKGDLGGIKYDESIYTVQVDIENVNGVLRAKATIRNNGETAESIIFKNEYTATPATVTVKGGKTLNGRELKDGEFVFSLIDSEGNVVESVKNRENGAFEFATLSFNTAGTYNYTVIEEKGTLSGITYDSQMFYVTVSVVDNGQGSLIPSVSYYKGNIAVSEIVFVNSYAATPVEVQFEASKVLNGRSLEQGEFEFRLFNTGTDKVVETVYNDIDGKITFAPITYRVADNYHYTVTEVINGRGGIDYDATVYAIHVSVKDDGNGALVADVEYLINNNAVESIEFNNTYTASPVSVNLSGTKELVGRELKESEFSFKLTDEAGNEETVTNDANGLFSFAEITYDKAGAYTYKVSEVKGQVNGITYDETVYNVTVTVTDNREGELVAKVEITDTNGNAVENVMFANVYSKQTATVKLSIDKTVDNKTSKPMSAEGFEFVLTQNGNVVKEVITDKDGRASIELSFNDSDAGKTFTYILSEVNGNITGMTYDSREYKFEITVGYSESGELTATVTKNGSTENATVADFVNVYDAIEPGDTSETLPWVLLLIVSGGAAISFGGKIKRKRRSY